MFYIDSQYVNRLVGKTIIVFDDVMTSGATLNESASTLKANGVLHVTNWVLLRTTRLA
jgi:predicted amidophosphoribosyltransferase